MRLASAIQAHLWLWDTQSPLPTSLTLGTCQCPWRAAQNRGRTPLLLVRATAAPRSSNSSHTSSLPRPAAAVRAVEKQRARDPLVAGKLPLASGPLHPRPPLGESVWIWQQPPATQHHGYDPRGSDVGYLWVLEGPGQKSLGTQMQAVGGWGWGTLMN